MKRRTKDEVMAIGYDTLCEEGKKVKNFDTTVSSSMPNPILWAAQVVAAVATIGMLGLFSMRKSRVSRSEKRVSKSSQGSNLDPGK
jgi:hypothetical protein